MKGMTKFKIYLTMAATVLTALGVPAAAPETTATRREATGAQVCRH